MRTTPFNIGQRIELADFTLREAAPLATRLSHDKAVAEALLNRIFFWTGGHPYLTQQLCREFVETADSRTLGDVEEAIDALADSLFLSARAREQDDNLLFVRERILRSEADLTKLLTLYAQIHSGDAVPDDETNDLINQLRLAGLAKVVAGVLKPRNRIYSVVFDEKWTETNIPDAELEKPNGERIRVKASCTIGRAHGNDLVLSDPKVSRQHALIQAQKHYEFWLLDLGSSNGTFVNGHRVTQPVLLRNGTTIEMGPFRLVFRQSRLGSPTVGDQTSMSETICGTTSRLLQNS